MVPKGFVIHFYFIQLVTSTTYIFSPSILHAMYWQTLTQEKNAAPLECVLKCEELHCPGVAYQRVKGLCLYGSVQTTPINGDGSILEIWKIKPLVEYAGSSSMSYKLLGQNDCKLFDTWVEQVNGKRYKVNPQTLSKKGQENFCKSQGGQLAMIKSKVEEDIITTLIGDNQTWIGITNFHNEICLNESCEDHLAWSDGTMFKYDANMYTKDFNFGAGHNCCRIKGLEYNDNDCASLYAGICEVTCSD